MVSSDMNSFKKQTAIRSSTQQEHTVYHSGPAQLLRYSKRLLFNRTTILLA